MVKFPIVGMKFRKPADTIMSLLPPDTPLFLVREPENEHDPKAIQVWIRNLAEVIPESLDDITQACNTAEPAVPVPDYTQPIMLGYIKAESVNEEVQGADLLADRIDALVGAGAISQASDIPCILVYGESGRPSLTIVQDEATQSDEGLEVEEAEDEEEIEGSDEPEVDLDFAPDDYTNQDE